jgi:hypothetical protein
MARSTGPLAALALALTLTLTLTVAPRDAAAFCRSTTCDIPDSFAQCDGAPSDCIPLTWMRSCIGWNIQRDASERVPYEVAEEALTQAFEAWQSAPCEGGLTPGLRIENLGEVTCANIEYNSAAGNTNAVIFRDRVWPHQGADHNIALTTVTYDVNTGEIFDADIEVNTNQFDLTWGVGAVKYDLVSIFAHEAGHFLGLSHSEVAEATMYRHYEQGTTDFRDLAVDDAQAMCAVYPPSDAVFQACNPIPRHGFSPDCKDQQKEGSCSAAPALAASTEDRSGDRGARSALAAAFALTLLRVTRARRRS